MRDLFGLELPTAVTFAIAFVVVLLLIGVLAWAVRRLTPIQARYIRMFYGETVVRELARNEGLRAS